MTKKDLTEIARIIKRTISIEDVIKYHNIGIKNKRIKCLFHPSDNYNMSYARKNSLYCPSCGEILNVVDLYKYLNGCDFITALQALDSIYNLGVFNIPNEQIKQQAEQYRLKQIKLERIESLASCNYIKLCEHFQWLNGLNYSNLSVEASTTVSYQLQMIEDFLDKRIIVEDMDDRILKLKLQIINHA